MGELDGKVAVITGAGSGMGKASARIFVREGARVVVSDISGSEKDTAAELGSAAVSFSCDVSNEDQVAALIEAAVTEFGRVDAMLNVAGVGAGGPLADLDMADYDRVLDVDLRGVLHGTKHAIRAMKDTGGGSIINWASLAGLNASPMTSVYSAAKAGVVAVTKATALEYGPAGIRANVICPGVILTEIMGAGWQTFSPELAEKAALGRAGRSEEVAELASFLASDRASYLSGCVIPADGGWSCQLA
jgi:NAD(P)-dependent dehydrogenase (short-subunit alcohol dehydrogenase family)